MVVVVAPEAVDMHRDPRGLREALETVRQHLGAQVANLLALEPEVSHAERPVRQVDDGARQRLV
jgi:hypothetical protein